MGRAARSRRQRRQTRTWHTRNPWTGAQESFRVCISDEALREWEENRVRLAAAGYPDRPPELDNPRVRVWNLVAPGRPITFDANDGAPPSAVLGADPSARGLGVWRSGDERHGVKINIGRRDDGTVVLHLVIQEGQQEESLLLRVHDAEEAREVVEGLGREVLPILSLPPLSWTSDDELLAGMAGAG